MARRGRPRPGGGGPPRKRRPNKYRYQKANGPVVPQLPDTQIAHLEDEVRAEVALLTKHQAQGHGLLESERLLSRVLEQHPEYADEVAGAAAWRVEGDPESPYVHLALHKIAEQRVVSRELDMSRLGTGLSWHDGLHKAMELIASELFGDELEGARA